MFRLRPKHWVPKTVIPTKAGTTFAVDTGLRRYDENQENVTVLLAYCPFSTGLRRSRQAWCASFLSSVSSSAMKR